MDYSEVFVEVYNETIRREGGYRLSHLKGDTGGLTYAGIARNMNPKWPGWDWVDRGQTPPTDLVREFYYNGYWVPIKGDYLPPQMAQELYDFAVNTSRAGRPTVAVKLFQLTVGAQPDGVVGPRTIEAAKRFPVEHFPAWFFVAKMTRYHQICLKNKDQRKWLTAWTGRALEAVQQGKRHERV